MAPLMTLEIDTAALLAALERFPALVQAHARDAAKVTADNIAREMASRIVRRTGTTASGITVEESHDGTGYVVFVKSPEMPGLPGWLEFGTRYMSKRDFFFPSALLESSAHDRRTRDAIQEAILDGGFESGLG